MLTKLLSGRFLFTCAAAFVFVRGALMKTIPDEAVVAIIMFVVQAYFQRNDRKKGGENV